MNLNDINFLVIGATKSATTWLQASLQLHPNVFMPDPEIHYFSRHYTRGSEWYLSQFAGYSNRHVLVGEKSNSYLDTEEAAVRIRSDLPHAKLIAQVRNPVDRAYSDYCMLLRRGTVSRDIATHLDPRQAAASRFVHGGLYYRQLSRFLDLFPKEQLLVVFYEALKVDPAENVTRVQSFLDLDGVSGVIVADKVKDKEAPLVGLGLRRVLRPFKPLVAPMRNYAFFKSMRMVVARRLEYPELSSDIRSRLVDYYEEEVDSLGKLLDVDLSRWLTSGIPPQADRMTSIPASA